MLSSFFTSNVLCTPRTAHSNVSCFSTLARVIKTTKSVLFKALQIVFLLNTLLPTTLRADTVQITGVDTLTEAETFARQYMSNNPEYFGDAVTRNERPIVQVLHLGDEIPNTTRWIILYLEAHGAKVQIETLTQAGFEAELQTQRQAAIEQVQELAVAEDPLSLSVRQQIYAQETPTQNDLQILIQNIRKLYNRAFLPARSLLGIPKGLTLWPQIKMKEEDRTRETRSAVFQSFVAAGQIAVTFSIKENIDVSNVIGAATTLGTWVFFNFYNMTRFNAIMGQGLTINRVGTQNFAVDRSVLTSRFLGYGRSILTNSLILIGAFGVPALINSGFDSAWNTIMTPENGARVLTNAFFSLFSRFWFDEWLIRNQATRLPDGRIVVEEGQHTPQQTNRYRTVFEIVQGVFKTMNLIGVESLGWVFPVSGMWGLAREAYAKRFGIWAGGQRLVQRMTRSRVNQECSTLLVSPRWQQ